LFKQFRVWATKDTMTNSSSKCVADAITKDCCSKQDEDSEIDVEPEDTGVHQEASGEKKAITGEEEADE